MSSKTSQRLGRNLWEASSYGNVAEVTRLLANGAPVNWRDPEHGYTALHRACEYRQVDVVKVLLRIGGARVNEQTKTQKNTPLHKACNVGSMHCVMLLLETGQCDLGIENLDGRTPLEEAVAKKKTDIVKHFFIKHNASQRRDYLPVWRHVHSSTMPKEHTNPSGRTPLGEAVHRDNVDLVRCYIIEDMADNNGNTPLGLAVYAGEFAVITYIHSRLNFDVNSTINKSGDTLLGLAVCNGKLDVIKHLITCKVNIIGPVNKHGDTALGLAIRVATVDVIKYLTEQAVDINFGQVATSGDTALGLAVREGKVEIVEHLIIERGVDVNGPVTSAKDTPLGLAIQVEKLSVITYFISEERVTIITGESGDTPLGLLVRMGKLNIIQYLSTETILDVNCPVTNSGDNALGLAIRKGKLAIVKFLIVEQKMDVSGPVTRAKDTPLELAVCEGMLDIVQYLVAEHNQEVNGTHLLKACENNHKGLVNYFLNDHHIDPNTETDSHQTPLSLAKNPEIMKLLLQHGAVAADTYALYRKELSKVFSKEPLQSPVRLFVVGDGGQGKSTLIEAMQHEPGPFDLLKNIFVAPKEVDGVSRRTAGIVTKVFKSRHYGDVLFYDFAGQEAYYSSHAVSINSAVSSCPPMLLLVIGLHRDISTITSSIYYWLGIIVDQCVKMEGRAPLVVIGSHVDLIKEKDDLDRKKQCIQRTVQKFPSFDLSGIISIDCRYSNSDGMKLLRRYIGTSCNLIRARLSVNLNSHMLLIYLLDTFSSEVVVTLKMIQAELQKGDQKHSQKSTEARSYIPTTIKRLHEICIQLNNGGHVLFLLNECSLEKSFVVIDKEAILSEINGTMFAPEDFKEHCGLSTSTGVVSQSRLARQFPRYDIIMLVRFLCHLELAVPIEDEEILKLIKERQRGRVVSNLPSQENYLFCPALVRLDVPENVFVYQERLAYHFGWIISCEHCDHFFNARFLHVLILRLALSLGFAPRIDQDVPALQHHCCVWKTGVCWSTTSGIKVLVEVIKKKKVVVLIQANTVSYELFGLRSTILQKVRKSAKEFCPSVETEELLLSPTNVTYPFNESLLGRSFCLTSLAASIVTEEPSVVSADSTETSLVSNLLSVEVYANLGQNILQALTNEDDPVHTTQISDRFLSALCSFWSKNPELVGVVCCAIRKKFENIPPHSPIDLKTILESWRENSHGTYKSLRQILDPLSVFAGRSPLQLSGIPEKDFSEELLPVLETKNDELSNSLEHSFEVLSLSSIVFPADGGSPEDYVDLSLHPEVIKQKEGDRDLSIEELMRETEVSDTLINQKVFDQDLFTLAGCFDGVQPYLTELELTSGQHTDILALYAGMKNTQTVMMKALKLWCEPNPFNATFKALLEIVLKLKKGVVAIGICRFIRDYVQFHT